MLFLELEVNEAKGLFRLLDIEGAGEVPIEDFVLGCMRLKGTAKNVDVVTLMYENKRMMHEMFNFFHFCDRRFAELAAAVGLEQAPAYVSVTRGKQQMSKTVPHAMGTDGELVSGADDAPLPPCHGQESPERHPQPAMLAALLAKAPG